MNEYYFERSPADRLAESLISKCKEDLTKLENKSQKQLDPETCFDLLSSLGELKHNRWTTASKSQKAKTNTERKRLQDQLLGRIQASDEFLSCLGAGYNRHISLIRRELARVLTNYERGRVGKGYTSYEINDGLLGLRDRLGYSDLLLEDLGIKLSSYNHAEAEKIDQDLRSLLPAVIDAFRLSNDNPTPFSDAFPAPFWWRHVL